MSITCPNCQLKGVVEAPQLLASARVVCARCKQPFEVDLNGHLEPAAPAANEMEKVGEVKAAMRSANEMNDDWEMPYSLPAGFASESGLASPQAPANYDKYGLGLRLMRVSPLWLLLSGLLFVSFVVFCNWVTTPNAQAGVQGSGNDARHAANFRPTSNQATNQSASGTAPR